MGLEKEISLMEQEIGCNLQVKSYKLLVKAPKLPEKTKGGIIRLIDESGCRDYNVGLVIGMGDACYKDYGDVKRFPNGPLCKIGDWIAFAPYERYEVMVNGVRCFIISDERVDMVIPPEDIGKIIVEMDG